MGDLKSTFARLYSAPVHENGFGQRADKLGVRYSTADGKSAQGTTFNHAMTVPGNGHPRDSVEMIDNRPTPDRVSPPDPKLPEIGNGDVLIAAITSCTNTSNPGVLLAAGLLAKKAVEQGLTVKPHIKTSLAPGSRVVTDYLGKAALLPYLEKLGLRRAADGRPTRIRHS